MVTEITPLANPGQAIYFMIYAGVLVRGARYPDLQETGRVHIV